MRRYQSPFTKHQRSAYQRGVQMVLDARELIGDMPRSVEMLVLYDQLHHAVECLAEVSPNDLHPSVRTRIARGL